ncbi:ATP-binding protein [Saccharothrix violaceirubra]|uniref:ATP-binding protein n=1 Tax=Saccharothrix violaceirubra TaxID=413306 RepID=A0A7W7SYX7_9PSEU|nr:ATP-binding protein [Saccharothrix violaceirubra]MBB4963519.1 hypothetical protein [Saccharothrix violaceirubra]
MRLPAHVDSTAQVRGALPWLAGPGLPAVGTVVGRERFSGGVFCFDPWRLYARGLLQDAGIFVAGVIGSGKSALAKSLCLRGVAFGRRFAVPGDIRGEWVPVVEALGGRVLRLGPGMPERLNALALPPKPEGMTDGQWWPVVRTHWEGLLEALIRTLLPGQRALTMDERTALETALTAASRWSGDLARVRPVHLGLVGSLLLDPTREMAAEHRVGLGVLRERLHEIGLAVRALTRGGFAGLVDDDRPGNQMDWRDTATVVDISRVKTSDLAVALVMATTQSVIELAFAHRPGQRFTVYDEAWRLSAFPALMARTNAGQKVSRATGNATIIVCHRVSDLFGGTEESRHYGQALLADCGTRVLYRQRGDVASLRLSERQASLLPLLDKGTALWTVDGRPFLIDHVVAPREWPLIDTDQTMLGRTP